MNKSKLVKWTEYSWNPITGLASADSKFARGKNFGGDYRLNIAQHIEQHGENGGYFVLGEPFRNAAGNIVNVPFGNEPTFHRYRLGFPDTLKAPSNIFVGSMTDIFADDVPEEWLLQIFEACMLYPRHNFLFLTSNPARYKDLYWRGLLHGFPNFWYGSNITSGHDDFISFSNLNCFANIEPRNRIDARKVEDIVAAAQWLVLGGAATPMARIEPFVKVAERRNVPVVCVPELCKAYPDKGLPQDYPEQLQVMAENGRKARLPQCAACCICKTERPMKEMLTVMTKQGRGSFGKVQVHICPENCAPLLGELLGGDTDLTPILREAINARGI